MPTKAEQILDALATLLAGGLDATVERNSAVPERIPADGLVIIRDGDPGEPERVLGSSHCYYEHAVPIEIFVEHGDASTRDSRFDTILAALDTALEGDSTLSGLVFGMTYGRPDIVTEGVEGGADIKTGVMDLVLDYETTSPLA